MDETLDIERSNKIILVMAFCLVLLVFLDQQAFRHYQIQTGYSDRSVSELARDRSAAVSEELRAPIKSSAESIFGKSRAILSTEKSLIPALQNSELQAHQRGQAIPNSDSGSVGGSQISINPVPDFYYLHFIRFRKGQAELVRVKRQVKQEHLSLGEVVTQLQKGPGLYERNLINAFDDSIVVHDLAVKNGTVYLNVNRQIHSKGSHVIQDRLDQIVHTITQFPQWHQIVLYVDGQLQARLGQTQIDISRPLHPRNRKVWDYKSKIQN